MGNVVIESRILIPARRCFCHWPVLATLYSEAYTRKHPDSSSTLFIPLLSNKHIIQLVIRFNASALCPPTRPKIIFHSKSMHLTSHKVNRKSPNRTPHYPLSSKRMKMFASKWLLAALLLFLFAEKLIKEFIKVISVHTIFSRS